MAFIAEDTVIKKRDTNYGDHRTIFIAIRATMMVNGRPRRGILDELAQQLGFKRKTVSRQWNNTQRKLAPLLFNHPEQEHGTIIQQNTQMLFETQHSARRKGNFKYDHAEM
jgi:hypothetical protein